MLLQMLFVDLNGLPFQIVATVTVLEIDVPCPKVWIRFQVTKYRTQVIRTYGTVRVETDNGTVVLNEVQSTMTSLMPR